MWKPVLSAANQVRSIFMPPKGRTLTWPSSLRLHGQPQCSSLHHLFVRVGYEVFDDILLAQPVAAADGIVEMVVEAVVGPRHAGGPAFRGHGVAAHRVDLGDQRDFQCRIGLGNRDRRPQTRATRANNRYVRLEYFHCLSPHP